MTKRAEGKHEPQPRGFHPTPAAAFAPLAPYLEPGADVIEPMAGDGSLCNHLFANGQVIVAATDIVPQHPNISQMDVHSYSISNTPAINYFVSNPPWPLPRQNGAPTLAIIETLRVIRPTWLLLPSDFMHNVYARDVMRYCGGLISVGRVKWVPGSADAGFDNCAWYLFGRRDNGGKIRFVPRVAAAEA